ncbi:MAG TPA: type II secretion system F family protein [Actinomycetes bacterium]|nr:type II secretion system F family protein [Actinomycetes bacterium]
MSGVAGSSGTLVAATLAGLAAAWALPAVARPRAPSRGPGPPPRGDLVLRHRLLWSLAAWVGGVTLVSGAAGWVVGAGAGVALWTVVGRAEPGAVRRDRELARRQLPHVVLLLAAVLRGGGSIPQALGQVSRALPGPATAALRLAEGRLRVGAPAAEVWADLAGDAALGPLGRALSRSEASGASVADGVARLAEDLGRTHRAEVEDLARTVGVKAALPLGVCLLPAFLLVGIVPVVVASLAALGW